MPGSRPDLSKQALTPASCCIKLNIGISSLIQALAAYPNSQSRIAGIRLGIEVVPLDTGSCPHPDSPYTMDSSTPQRARVTPSLSSKLASSQLALPPTPAKVPDPPTPPKVQLQSHLGDPEVGAQTAFMQGMVRAIDRDGAFGLAIFVFERAKDLASSHPGWEMEPKDLYHVMVLIRTLRRDILRSLAQNTLLEDMERDPVLRQWAQTHMTVQAGSAIHGAGVYANVLARPARTGRLTTTGPTRFPGRYLTAEHIQALIRDKTLYQASTPDADRVARRIDGFQAPVTRVPRHDSMRRWKSSVDSEALAKKKHLFLARAPLGAPPFKRTPFEIGLTWDLDVRLKHHRDLDNTNHVFGFESAWGQQNGVDALELFQFAVFLMTEANADDLARAEIVATILTSSMWSEGGLNPSVPGHCPQHKPKNPTHARQRFSFNARSVFLGRPHILVELREDGNRLQSRFDLYQRFGMIPRIQERIEEAEADVAVAEPQMSKLRQERDTLFRANRQQAKQRAKTTGVVKGKWAGLRAKLKAHEACLESLDAARIVAVKVAMDGAYVPATDTEAASAI